MRYLRIVIIIINIISNKLNLSHSVAVTLWKFLCSVHLQKTLFFESNHGQSEGDSMHSEIEQNLARTEEVCHPCQLSNIIEDKPLRVGHVKTSDIVDWKS